MALVVWVKRLKSQAHSQRHLRCLQAPRAVPPYRERLALSQHALQKCRSQRPRQREEVKGEPRVGINYVQTHTTKKTLNSDERPVQSLAEARQLPNLGPCLHPAPGKEYFTNISEKGLGGFPLSKQLLAPTTQNISLSPRVRGRYLRRPMSCGPSPQAPGSVTLV